MNVEAGRHLGVDRVETLQELLTAMAPMQFADDPTGRHIERREQRGRPVAYVIMRAPLRLARPQPQDRRRAVQRLNLAFSSTDKSSARSGGLKYRPTMSRTLSMNNGSFDSLKVSTRCGCSAKAYQMRAIAV